jgi:predicted dehydrogenase
LAEGEVRIGIIGSGGIAGAHAERYKNIPGARIVAVADVVPGRAAAFIERYGFEGARPFSDHREMLKDDFDGVSVCTFNAAHYQPTMDALAAGKHVLLEKPMAVRLAEGVDMVRLARRMGRILTIGFQTRYEERTIAARRIVESGTLGRIYYAETGGGRRKGIPGGTFVRRETAIGGAVLDIGCYSLDTALHVMGNPRPLTVSAFTADHFGKSPVYARQAWGGTMTPEDFTVEDFGMAMIRLEGDAVLLFKISWAMHAETLGASYFLGTEGGLNMDQMTVYHDQYGVGAATTVPVGGRGGGGRRGRDPFFRKIEAFVEAIRAGGPAPIPGEDEIHATAIIEAIYRSAAERSEVRIEIPPL